MNIWIKFLLLGFATLFVIFDAVLFVICKNDTFNKTNLKVFFLEDYFFLGNKILTLFRRGINGKRIRKLEEIYDSATSGQIARSAAAAPYTYIILFAPIVLIIFLLSESKLALVLIGFLVLFLCFYFDIWLENILSRRHEEILREFATVLSKMSLLVNAGITANEAFYRVANSNDTILYLEMQRTEDDIKNGKPINDALDDFSFRCGCKEVRKFVSLYKQNLIKGGPEFPELISNMADVAWENRKTRAKLLSSSAEQKLLIPIMLMFVGVLFMIIVPAFNNLL